MTKSKGIGRGAQADEGWPPEMKAALVEYCSTEMSYSEIAKAINARFPLDPIANPAPKTRNSVLGKAYRMGLRDGKPKSYDAAKAKPRKGKGMGRPRKQPAAGLDPVILRSESDRGSHPAPQRRVLNSNDPKLVERKKGYLPCVIEQHPLTSRPVSECGRECCQWPTSNDIECMEVCGADVEVGAYCVRHAQVAYRIMPTVRRNRSFRKTDQYQSVGLDNPLTGRRATLLLTDDTAR